MNQVDKRKRSCSSDEVNHKFHETSRFRPKRRKLEGSSIGSFETKESYKLDKLPSNCLRNILSFINFEKVSEMRQVSKAFNDNCIKRLDNGQRELEKRLGIEIERAERRVFFPTNVRSSYDIFRFLTDVQEAVYNCKEIYSFHTVHYFVAGKLLDEANRLLTNINSWAIVPYFREHVCDQKKHPLLGPIVAQSKKAQRHFRTKILSKNYWDRREAEVERYKQNNADLMTLKNQYKKKVIKIKLLENRKKTLRFGNETSEELYKLISELNDTVLRLTRTANEMYEEAERVIRGTSKLDKARGNCLFRVPVRYPLRSGSEPRLINLATLPSSCVRSIVSRLNGDKIAQLRIVCKSFNVACKKELIREFEKLKQKLDFEIKYYVKKNRPVHLTSKLYNLRITVMKDLSSFLQLCKDNYKCYLGSNNYYFAAGKVLDEANSIYNAFNPSYNHNQNGLNVDSDDEDEEDDDEEVDDDVDDDNYCEDILIYDFRYRPDYVLFSLMDLVYKAIAHFKFNIVPNYFLTIQHPIYVPDFMVSGEKVDFEKESHLSLEEIEKQIEEADAKIKERNVRNRKLLNITSGLKKKVVVLNREVSEKINVLKEFEIKFKML